MPRWIYLAWLGLDPNQAAFFRQSDVPEVCELSWMFGTLINMGMLERATSYKDKIAKGIEPSVGLFTYPVLMAADILIYRPDLVPVGEDQVQHVEMTRDIAERFNRVYEEVFPLPNYKLDVGAKVPGTDGQKMSKSYGNTIEIFAEGKALQKSVKTIVTDSTPVEAPKDPEKCTVFTLFKLFATLEEQAALRGAISGWGHGLWGGQDQIAGEDRRLFRPVPRAPKEARRRPGIRRGRAERRREESASRSGQDDGTGANGGRIWSAAAGLVANAACGYVPSKRILREGGYETRGLYAGGIGLFEPKAAGSAGRGSGETFQGSGTGNEGGCAQK